MGRIAARAKNEHRGRITAVTLILLLIFSVSFLSACGETGDTASAGAGSRNAVFTVGGENCSVEEAKVILLQFQKDSSDQYGIDMWENENVDRTGLVQYIKNSAVSQLAQVYSLNVTAKELGIELTDVETQTTEEAAQAYLNSLSKEEKKYLGISDGATQQLFASYLLAQRTYDYITRNVSTEVSDSEALVMDVKQIGVSDEITAEAILERARDGEDFASLASKYSQDSETELFVSRTTFDDDSVLEQILALGDGECTDVIEYDGMYRIYYCDQYFDEERTDENRAVVLEQRRADTVEELCKTYADPEDAVLRNSVWGKVEVDTTLELAGPSFREVYESFFPG